MLELLWVRDEAEARRSDLDRVKLWERWKYRETGYCPFGVCLRPKHAADVTLDFDTWSFRPPYLPDDQDLNIAEDSTRLTEPIIFYLSSARRPDEYLGQRRQPLDHPAGIKEVTGLCLTLPENVSPSAALRVVESSGAAEVVAGSEFLAEIVFDGGTKNQVHDLRPALPLILRM